MAESSNSALAHSAPPQAADAVILEAFDQWLAAKRKSYALTAVDYDVKLKELLYEEGCAAEKTVHDTPAASLAGVATKLRLFIGLTISGLEADLAFIAIAGRNLEPEEPNDAAQKLIVAAIRDLERLAGMTPSAV